MDPQTPSQLLINKDWKLIAAGFDDNRNNVIDDFENQLQDCAKDNSYQYSHNGKGSVLDNAMSCGGPDKTDFTWQLITAQELKVDNSILSVKRLTNDSMTLIPHLPSMTVDFILNYVH